MLAELVGGVERDGAVAVSPDEFDGGGERRAQELAQGAHVTVPAGEQTQQMLDGSGGAEVLAVGFEAFGAVPALRTGHAAQGHHLHPLRVPRHGVSQKSARQREVETDQQITFPEVGMRGGEEVARGGTEAGVERRVALRLAGAGEIERDDMLVCVERLHEREEGLGAAHESVQQNERGSVRRRTSLFQVGESQTVEMEVASMQHEGCSRNRRKAPSPLSL